MFLEVLVSLVCGGVAAYLLIRKAFPWLPEDLYFLVSTMHLSAKIFKDVAKKRFLVDWFEEKVRQRGEKTFLRYEGESYSYREVNEMAVKTARALQELGFKSGDIVSVFMENEPAYIWTYLGLMKLGVRMGCINVNLRSRSLIHCLKVSGAKICLVGKDEHLLEAMQDIKSEVFEMRMFSFELKPKHLMFESFQQIVDRMPSDEIDRKLRSGVSAHDCMCLVYTSGTTGLPKGAVVTNFKLLRGSYILNFDGVSENDVFYLTLPLYHGSALLLSVSSVIRSGATLVLRRKFSATHFWTDCRKYDVTVVTYIGELCRYLLARPPSKEDGEHKIRLAFGNGLRMDIWEEFTTRFNIPRVLEFYAATECSVAFLNLNNIKGSIGRVSPLLRILSKTYFLKFDPVTEQPIRNEKGFCVASELGEVGLTVVKRTNFTPYEGYVNNEKETNRKLLHDVFQKGDSFFNTGDLFLVDKDYNLYFNDRIGDTFRWKGENVSTTEVSNALSDLPYIVDASVYGVVVPGGDGKVGMAAILLSDRHTSLSRDQMSGIFRHCSEILPPYAVPRFLRIEQEIAMTGTFKQSKTQFMKEGFDTATVKHGLYILDMQEKTYTELTPDVYAEVMAERRRL